MKSISDLTAFYYDKLHPVLKKLDKKREEIRFRITISVVGILLFDLIFLTYFKQALYWLLAGDFIVGSLLYRYFMRDYKQEFKDKIMAPLIQEIDQNLVYLKNMHIQQSLFEKSKIFTEVPDKFSGNDYIHGQIDDVEIELSDVFAQTKKKNSKGETYWKTLFQGLFITAQFNKNFKGKTVILPDYLHDTVGGLVGNWLQSHNHNRDMLVKMDSVAFEKKFVVYATDQIEARYILTNSMMERLVSFQKKSKQRLSVSFVDSQIYLAIDYGKDLFEPVLFNSLLDYKVAIEYIQTLHLAIGLVEELKLNEKLWSKV